MSKRIDRLHMVEQLLSGVEESLKAYEDAEKESGFSPMTGYGLDSCNGKYSIQRRITVIREELLKLSKSLEITGNG